MVPDLLGVLLAHKINNHCPKRNRTLKGQEMKSRKACSPKAFQFPKEKTQELHFKSARAIHALNRHEKHEAHWISLHCNSCYLHYGLYCKS